MVRAEVKDVQGGRLFEPLHNGFDAPVLQVAIVEEELLDGAHVWDDRGQILRALQAQIVVRKVERGDRCNMVLEGFHDDQRLAWFQAIVYKDDGENGESVPLDGLGHRVCSLRRCQILIGKVDYGVLRVLD